MYARNCLDMENKFTHLLEHFEIINVENDKKVRDVKTEFND